MIACVHGKSDSHVHCCCCRIRLRVCKNQAPRARRRQHRLRLHRRWQRRTPAAILAALGLEDRRHRDEAPTRPRWVLSLVWTLMPAHPPKPISKSARPAIPHAGQAPIPSASLPQLQAITSPQKIAPHQEVRTASLVIVGKFVSIFVVGFVTCVFLCVKKMEIQPGRVEQLFLRQYLFAGVCCPAIFSFS